MPIAVVTDSTASLSADSLAASGISVVPIQVVIGAETFVDGPGVTADMISAALRAFMPVNTSRPSPLAFAEVYAAAVAAGADQIVSVHLSSKISGTYESAVLAGRDAGVPVHAVDTGQVGIAAGFCAVNAARVAAAGGDVEAVVAAARKSAAGAATYFYVDTLEFLRRGGRIGAAAALIGSALAVKPLLTVTDGQIAALEKVRTSTKALGRLHDLVVAHVGDGAAGFDVGVQHLANEAVARSIAGRIAQTLGIGDIPVREVGASIGAHVGPGMISVGAVPRIE
ncbi:DegV family protein [soil metagenome]